jgi:hypothetical protein
MRGSQRYEECVRKFGAVRVVKLLCLRRLGFVLGVLGEGTGFLWYNSPTLA